MGGFDPTKYGAIPVSHGDGFDPSKYGAVPISEGGPPNLSKQNAIIDQMLARNPQPKPYYGFTPSNVLENAWEGAKALASGTTALASDLVTNPNWFSGPHSTLQKFVYGPSEQQTVEAGQALERGQTLPAIGHAVASALPLVGPWAASLGEQSGRGDIGGAAGQAAGTLAAGEASSLALKGIAKVPKIAGKANLDVMIGTNPERIAEIAQVPGKMAAVQSMVTAAERSSRAKAAANFPDIQNPVELSRKTIEQPTGLLDESGNPITRPVEQVEHITFRELQRQYSELGMRIAQEKEAVRNGAPAFELKSLIEQRKGVNDLMTKAASNEGKLGALDKARDAWAKFENDFHNPGSPLRGLLSLRPDQTAEIASQLNRGTNAARAVETLKSNGFDPFLIRNIMGAGRKPLAVDVTESNKLRTAGSVEGYRLQRLRESLRQATTNEMPSGSEARLPAWSMRRLLPGIFGEIPVGPREITAYRLRNALKK